MIALIASSQLLISQVTGAPFQVNTFNDPADQRSDQEAPAIAADTAGNFVITWQSHRQDGDRTGFYSQRYGSDGSPLGDEFRVTTTTADQQENPDVAMDASGNFVVIWEGEGSDPARGEGADSDRGIFGQRYDSTGNPLGVEFQINTTIKATQSDTMVAMDASGNFVVAWGSRLANNTSYHVFIQRYDAQGVAQGEESLVTTADVSTDAKLDVAMDASGNFVVVWSTEVNSKNNDNIMAQR
ncbi:MAG: hypothetical protein ACFCVD_20685 [Nodosilinea sp.]